jgi:branched-subunit amino acid aminotransferase/4-amino-4-deoxychorismate lyase
VSVTFRAPGAPSETLRETCRVVAGRVPLWAFHRARLAAGGCGGATLERVEELAIETASQWDSAESLRVRLSLTVSPDGEVAVDARRRLSSLDVPGGPMVARIDVAAPPQLPAGAAKPANRAWWDEAQRRARLAGTHQAIAVTRDGFIVDGGTATVWIAEGPDLSTPPAPPAVAGVARAFLMAAAVEPRIRVSIEPISWERFVEADEAFLTNAFGGAVAVRSRGGLVFNAVRELFEHMWRSAN